MIARSTALGLVLAVAAGSAACLPAGEWPGRPGPVRGAPKKAGPIVGDAEILAQVRGDASNMRDGRSNKYPVKAYWVAEPDWKPVRNLAGGLMGRRTANTTIVKVMRLDGSGNKWPDLCIYEEVTVRQDALDPDASTWGPAKIDQIVKRGEIDCAFYEGAP